MRKFGLLVATSWVPGLLFGGSVLSGQDALPLEPPRPSGLAVSPIYEGWYKNPDGTITVSFGYLNRNLQEIVDIPVGNGNNMSPGEMDLGQPTHFLPRRQYGVFTVTVPADFGNREIVWTLDIRGHRYSIPGRLHVNYEIDALGAPATGVKPPSLKFDPAGPEARGPKGVSNGPLTVAVGKPLDLTVYSKDDRGMTVTLRWALYRGPADVTFGAETIPVDRQLPDGKASTTATFAAPGEYILYVRANNSAVVSAGQEQCCWTNGFVKVNVTPGTTP